ncbi:MAG: phosphoribosylaminoimidazolesuccinocarboxamide synthase [Planctomycetes bacterium]|nr:phosphoribosylaminoimidazolesuccinocarboxamide synthase [Planctomycetota bacterium]
MANDVVIETNLEGLTLFNRGKVRDIYDLGDNLLIVASDRISAFDSILGSGIPLKGKVLTQISLFWFDFLQDITDSHLVTGEVEQMPEAVREHADILRGRSMLVHKTDVLPIECVVRGYLAGSGWKDYKATGSVCGIPLPAGLIEADKLPEPIFTPATKAESGHDINISHEEMAEKIGQGHADALRDRTLDIYTTASAYARSKGIIIADTKFEWGLHNGNPILIDEVLTPDSSRFWPVDKYRPGGAQPSFDKQPVRDYLEASGWNKEPPAPALPDDVVKQTTERYLEAFRRLTGKDLTG